MSYEDDDHWDNPSWINIGHDHAVKFTSWNPDRTINPQYADLPDVPKWGLLVKHLDRNGNRCMGAITFDGEVQRRLTPDRARWQVVSLEPETLHVEPSLLCSCGDHGFIHGGMWVPA